MMTDRQQIEALVSSYLDGLYHCDTQSLAAVFHPQAVYATAAGEQPLVMRLPEYLAVVAQRDPPARVRAPRSEEILGIDIEGHATALVKLRCSFFQKDYVDFLSLIRTEGRWVIIAKVFHYRTAQAAGLGAGSSSITALPKR